MLGLPTVHLSSGFHSSNFDIQRAPGADLMHGCEPDASANDYFASVLAW